MLRGGARFVVTKIWKFRINHGALSWPRLKGKYPTIIQAGTKRAGRGADPRLTSRPAWHRHPRRPRDGARVGDRRAGQEARRRPTKSHAVTRTLLKAWSAGRVAAADAMMLDVTIDLFSTQGSTRGLLSKAEAFDRGIDPPTLVFNGREADGRRIPTERKAHNTQILLITSGPRATAPHPTQVTHAPGQEPDLQT